MNCKLSNKASSQNRWQNLLICMLPFILLLGTVAGCEGPTGEQGPQGPEGEEGKIGPAGDDGSIIHAGSGPPEASVGTGGDFYLNQDNGELYGPKNGESWGTPISLQGPPGADGEDGRNGTDGENGSQIHSGDGAPGTSLGMTGDYYLDRSRYELYGPKTGSGWGSPINLKGTANVIYSSWTQLDSAVRDTIIDASNLKVGDINAPQISRNILDKGAINVYYMNLGNDVYPLPYTSFVGGVGNTMDFLPRLNKILITRFAFDNSGSVSLSSSLQYRYVLIPGGVAAKSKFTKEQIEKMSYQEVKKRFGIRD